MYCLLLFLLGMPSVTPVVKFAVEVTQAFLNFFYGPVGVNSASDGYVVEVVEKASTHDSGSDTEDFFGNIGVLVFNSLIPVIVVLPDSYKGFPNGLKSFYLRWSLILTIVRLDGYDDVYSNTHSSRKLEMTWHFYSPKISLLESFGHHVVELDIEAIRTRFNVNEILLQVQEVIVSFPWNLIRLDEIKLLAHGICISRKRRSRRSSSKRTSRSLAFDLLMLAIGFIGIMDSGLLNYALVASQQCLLHHGCTYGFLRLRLSFDCALGFAIGCIGKLVASIASSGVSNLALRMQTALVLLRSLPSIIDFTLLSAVILLDPREVSNLARLWRSL